MNNSSPAKTDESLNFQTSDENIVAAFFVAVVMLLTLAGNIIVCVCFYCYRDLRTICNYFIISLSISDILVALLAMPFWLVLQFADLHKAAPLPPNLHIFWSTIDILVGSASVMNLVAVSFDRYLAITKPFSYNEYLTSFRAIVLIAMLWVFSFILYGIRFSGEPRSTFMKAYQVVTVVVVFIIPLLVMILLYMKIYAVARSQALRIGRNYAKDIKATKTIAVVIGAFLVCWMPFFVAVTIFAFSSNGGEIVTIPVFKAIKWMQYLNSCLNPIIYNCTNRTYRRAFKKLFIRSICCSRSRSSEPLDYHTAVHKTSAKALSDSSCSVSENGNVCIKRDIIMQEADDKTQGTSV